MNDSSKSFWAVISDQLKELESAKSAGDVIRILGPDRNPYGPNWGGADGEGFFAGSGGDSTVDDALAAAGWRYLWSRASHWWAMQAPDGTVVTYCEGDVYNSAPPRTGGE